MDIDYLANHNDFIPTLARWHFEEWSYLRPGESLDERTARLRAACGHAEIPSVVVAFRDGELLGSAMLVAQDMDTRPELSPWLAGVYVRRDCRHQRIGSALVRSVEALAVTLGHARLHLYTPDHAEFYERLGWSLLERATYRDVPVAVMMKEWPTPKSVARSARD